MSEENYYELLGATIESTQEEIRKCYKRRALDYHPDKIKGKPELVGMFEKVQKAYEFLTDESKKKTYDANIRAKMERQIQLQKQDVEVQRMRAELERKEKEAAEARAQGKDLNLKFVKRAPIPEKLTPEAKLLAAEEALKKKRAEFTRQQSAELIAEMTRVGQLQRRPSSKINIKIPTQEDVKRTAARAETQPPSTQLNSQDENNDKDRTITVRWKKRKRIQEGVSEEAPKSDYNEDSLRSLFRVYGRIAHIVVRQRTRRALIVFTHKDEALKATQSKTPAEGLRVDFLPASKSKSATSKSSILSDNNSSENETEQKHECSSKSSTSTQTPVPTRPSPTPMARRPLSSIIDHEDYESQTLLRMQRLMEQRKLQQQPQASAVVT